MMRLASFIILLACVPMGVHAATEQSFDLRAGEVNADWRGIGSLTMERQENGILLTSGASTGILVTDTQPTITPDSAFIVANAPDPTRILFVWSNTGIPSPDTSFVELMIGNGTGGEELLLSRYDNWNDEKKTMGILLPPFSTILLQKIDFYEWSFGDAFTVGFKSLGAFDEMRPYSINFVWGPYLAFNIFELDALYQNLPPIATSVTKLLNILIVLLLVLVIVGKRFLPLLSQKRAVSIVIVVWLLLDLYMGVQFLSWVKNDHSRYIAGSPEVREFRDRGHFYDFAEAARPLVQDRSKYIFVAEVPWPYLGNIRYLTYPSIPAFDIENDDTWVIYNRKDFGINEAGQLTIGADPVTEPGEVLYAHTPDSFVFRGKALLPAQEQ